MGCDIEKGEARKYWKKEALGDFSKSHTESYDTKASADDYYKRRTVDCENSKRDPLS